MSDDPRPSIGVPYELVHQDCVMSGPATVKYLVNWADAFPFHDEILFRPPPPGVEFPDDVPGAGRRATLAVIEPRGDRPWTKAVVTVEYEPPDHRG